MKSRRHLKFATRNHKICLEIDRQDESRSESKELQIQIEKRDTKPDNENTKWSKMKEMEGGAG